MQRNHNLKRILTLLFLVSMLIIAVSCRQANEHAERSAEVSPISQSSAEPAESPSPSLSPTLSSSPSPQPSPFPPNRQDNETPQASKPAAQASKADKQAIDSRYEKKLAALRDECRAAGERLVEQAIAELQDGDPDALKSKYLAKALQEEAKCEGKFQSLLAQAKAEYEQAGIAADSMPDWQGTYEEEEANARSEMAAKLLQGGNRKSAETP